MRKRNVLIALIWIMNFTVSWTQWQQVGANLTGDVDEFTYGKNVCISPNGEFMAIDFSNNLFPSNAIKKVKTYQIRDNSLVHIGQVLLDEAVGLYFGESISFSNDGQIMAIGAIANFGYVKVYRLEGDVWELMGDKIEGIHQDAVFARSIDLSADGKLLAIGVPQINNGLVKVYQFVNGNWVLRGSVLNGENQGDQFGYKLCLSDDGKTMAVSSPSANKEGKASVGKVQVYKWDGVDWKVIGQTLKGDNAYQDYGKYLDMNAAGNRLTIGLPLNDEGGNNSGKIVSYKLDNNTWQQDGTLVGANGELKLGESFSISADGLTMAVGMPNDNTNNTNAGQTAVYVLSDGNWIQLDNAILGVNRFDYFGAQVRLSADGNRLVSYASGFNNIHGNEGLVKIYDQKISTDILTDNHEEIRLFPNPVRDRLHVEFGKSYMGKAQIKIYNVSGKCVLVKSVDSKESIELEIAHLRAGLYAVQLQYQDEVIVKQIVKQ